MSQVHALSVPYPGIVNQLLSHIKLENTATNTVLDSLGLWDTGATNSAITESAAKSLGLIPIGKTVVSGVHTEKEVNVYYLKIVLNNDRIVITERVTECSKLAADDSVGLLIGMNIIQKGDFAITNFQGNTVMTFRVPSCQKIDFVQGIKSMTPIVSSKVPGVNDPCSCGSGKKYKHCCGKK